MAKLPGAIYQGKEGRYLALYNFQHDVYAKTSQDLEHMAHFSYTRGNKKGAVDCFALPDNIKGEDLASVKKYFELRNKGVVIDDQRLNERRVIAGKHTMNAPQKYDIALEIIKTSESKKDEIAKFIVSDIVDFAGENIAKSNRRIPASIVEKIIPRTKLERVTPKHMLQGGKQAFLKDCLLEANIDFMKGCITSFAPGENPSFDGEYFTDFFSVPSNECGYCYAQRQHKSFPKSFHEFNLQQLIEELSGDARLKYGSEEKFGKPITFLRFGKRTESWTPYTESEFVQTLEACIKTGTRPIIPTKLLPHTPKMAKLLKRSGASLIYSIGNSKTSAIEKGAVEIYGSTNEWRLSQAEQYAKAGVNASIYLMIPGHAPISKEHLDVLKRTNYGSKVNIQLLPLRLSENKLVESLLGQKKMILSDPDVDQGMLFLDTPDRGTYIRQRATILAKTIHPQWMNLVGVNNGDIRMCHHDDKKIYCGGCFQDKGFIKPL